MPFHARSPMLFPAAEDQQLGAHLAAGDVFVAEVDLGEPRLEERNARCWNAEWSAVPAREWTTTVAGFFLTAGFVPAAGAPAGSTGSKHPHHRNTHHATHGTQKAPPSYSACHRERDSFAEP